MWAYFYEPSPEYNPPDEVYFNETVQDYKTLLEAKYPPVCSNCAMRVRAFLAEACTKVQDRLMRERLETLESHEGLPLGKYSNKISLFLGAWSTLLLLLTVIGTLCIDTYGMFVMCPNRCDMVLTG